MLGVLGSDQFVKDADYQNHWNIGMIDCCNLLKPMHLNLKNPEKIESVSAISGVIMITQEDIIWREDIFKGVCFYDISQSIEFQNGVTIIVDITILKNIKIEKFFVKNINSMVTNI